MAFDADLASVHLLARLDEDARSFVPAQPRSRIAADGPTFHRSIHGELAHVRRQLRISRPGLSLHAAAVDVRGVGVLVVGRSQAGKSTLVVGLSVDQGGGLISDDTVWLDGREVRGFGAPATLRRGNAYWSRASQTWYGCDAERLVVDVSDLGGTPAAGPVTIDVIVLPSFGEATPTHVQRCRPGRAFVEIMAAITGPSGPGVVDQVLDLVSSVAAFEVAYGDSDGAHRGVLDAIARAAVAADVANPHQLEPDSIRRAGLGRHTRGVRFGDHAVLWSTRTGGVAEVAGWTGRSLRGLPVYADLVRMGLAIDSR